MKSIRVCGLFVAALACAILLFAQTQKRHVEQFASTAALTAATSR